MGNARFAIPLHKIETAWESFCPALQKMCCQGVCHARHVGKWIQCNLKLGLCKQIIHWARQTTDLDGLATKKHNKSRCIFCNCEAPLASNNQRICCVGNCMHDFNQLCINVCYRSPVDAAHVSPGPFGERKRMVIQSKQGTHARTWSNIGRFV